MINKLRKELKILANPKKAKIYQRFFKTGIGEYGYGDKFLGLTVPQSRKIAIKYKDLSFSDIKIILKSKIHEERLIAVLLLVNRFSQKDKEEDKEKRRIFDFYLAHTKHINNWDLVDLSADKIVGEYLLSVLSCQLSDPSSSVVSSSVDTPHILINLARSSNLWERRIAMIATFQFIKKKKEHEWTFKIAKILLNDKHDLIHKAVGWMLREVGKNCSQKVLEDFLKKHYKQMPRTMLRYAIERFPENLRKRYLL